MMSGGQQITVNPKRAGWYAGAFSMGLFITIATVGIVCAMLGRMLGDVGIWLQVAVGAVLIWVALGMMGVQACTMSGESSAAAVRRLIESAAWQGAGTWFRKGAGVVIGLLGVYFIYHRTVCKANLMRPLSALRRKAF